MDSLNQFDTTPENGISPWQLKPLTLTRAGFYSFCGFDGLAVKAGPFRPSRRYRRLARLERISSAQDHCNGRVTRVYAAGSVDMSAALGPRRSELDADLSMHTGLFSTVPFKD